MEETTSQKKKRLEKRNKYRSTICSGCRHNYYNFPKGPSENGDVEVSDDYSCWSITSILRGKCSAYSRY